VPSRRREKPQPGGFKPEAAAKPQGQRGGHEEGSGASESTEGATQACAGRAAGQHQGARAQWCSENKAKGLQHFQRVEVGIEDDPEFRVVQRLIGPGGKYMQDIVAKSKGAKIWIIGRGSRSWEDNTGPLMICVGAASSSVFNVAIKLVQELLGKVHEDHKKFLV